MDKKGDRGKRGKINEQRDNGMQPTQNQIEEKNKNKTYLYLNDTTILNTIHTLCSLLSGL